MKKTKLTKTPSLSNVQDMAKINDPEALQRILAIQPNYYELLKACKNCDSLILARHGDEKPITEKERKIKDLLECNQNNNF